MLIPFIDLTVSMALLLCRREKFVRDYEIG